MFYLGQGIGQGKENQAQGKGVFKNKQTKPIHGADRSTSVSQLGSRPRDHALL